jgi:hypothetical protein
MTMSLSMVITNMYIGTLQKWTFPHDYIDHKCRR